MNATLAPENERLSSGSAKESYLIAVFSAASIILLLMRWFDFPAAAELFGSTAFSGIGLVNLYRNYSEFFSESGLHVIVLPAVCQGICIVLHIVTILLLLFGDSNNAYANSGTSSLVSLAISSVTFGVFSSSDMAIFLNEWFYLFLILTVINLVFSARVALGRKMLS